jgi:hypothetical protein
MTNYELERALFELENLKEELHQYLALSYQKGEENSERDAEHTYKYLEAAISKIIKRQAYSLKWSAGGTPAWHATILGFVSEWVKLELKISDLLSKSLSDID